MQIKEVEHHLLRHLLNHEDGSSHDDLVNMMKSEHNLSDHEESEFRKHLRQWHQDWVERGHMVDQGSPWSRLSPEGQLTASQMLSGGFGFRR